MSAHARNVAAIAMVLLALCRADAAGKDATLADTQRPESADDLNRRGADLEREGRYTEAEAQFFLSRDACRRNACPFLAANSQQPGKPVLRSGPASGSGTGVASSH